jgi:hypothetical protein
MSNTKFTDNPTNTSLANTDIFAFSADNTPSPGFTSKKITWANIKAALTALIGGDVYGPGMLVESDNLAAWDGTTGTHIKDSGVAITKILQSIDAFDSVVTIPMNARIDKTTIQCIGMNTDVQIGITPGGDELSGGIMACPAGGFIELGGLDLNQYFDKLADVPIFIRHNNSIGHSYIRFDLTLNFWA